MSSPKIKIKFNPQNQRTPSNLERPDLKNGPLPLGPGNLSISKTLPGQGLSLSSSATKRKRSLDGDEPALAAPNNAEISNQDRGLQQIKFATFKQSIKVKPVASLPNRLDRPPTSSSNSLTNSFLAPPFKRSYDELLSGGPTQGLEPDTSGRGLHASKRRHSMSSSIFSDGRPLPAASQLSDRSDDRAGSYQTTSRADSFSFSGASSRGPAFVDEESFGADSRSADPASHDSAIRVQGRIRLAPFDQASHLGIGSGIQPGINGGGQGPGPPRLKLKLAVNPGRPLNLGGPPGFPTVRIPSFPGPLGEATAAAAPKVVGRGGPLRTGGRGKVGRPAGSRKSAGYHESSDEPDGFLDGFGLDDGGDVGADLYGADELRPAGRGGRSGGRGRGRGAGRGAGASGFGGGGGGHVGGAGIQTSDFERVLEQIVKQDKDSVFANPVTEDVAPGYFSVIEKPMDLSTIRAKARTGVYASWDELERDLLVMTSNCKKYNGPGPLHELAEHMEAMALKYIQCGRDGRDTFRGVAAQVCRRLYARAKQQDGTQGEGAGGQSVPPPEALGPRNKFNSAVLQGLIRSEGRVSRHQLHLLELQQQQGESAGVDGDPSSSSRFHPHPQHHQLLLQQQQALLASKRRKKNFRLLPQAVPMAQPLSGENRYSYRAKIAPYGLSHLGGLLSGASGEGLPYLALAGSLRKPVMQPVRQLKINAELGPSAGIPDGPGASIGRGVGKGPSVSPSRAYVTSVQRFAAGSILFRDRIKELIKGKEEKSGGGARREDLRDDAGVEMDMSQGLRTWLALHLANQLKKDLSLSSVATPTGNGMKDAGASAPCPPIQGFPPIVSPPLGGTAGPNAAPPAAGGGFSLPSAGLLATPPLVSPPLPQLKPPSGPAKVFPKLSPPSDASGMLLAPNHVPGSVAASTAADGSISPSMSLTNGTLMSGAGMGSSGSLAAQPAVVPSAGYPVSYVMSGAKPPEYPVASPAAGLQPSLMQQQFLPPMQTGAMSRPMLPRTQQPLSSPMPQYMQHPQQPVQQQQQQYQQPPTQQQLHERHLQQQQQQYQQQLQEQHYQQQLMQQQQQQQISSGAVQSQGAVGNAYYVNRT